MSKVTLEFNLPDEKDEYESAYHGNSYYAMIWDFGEWLRRKYKHEDPKTKAHCEEYEEILTRWGEITDGF